MKKRPSKKISGIFSIASLFGSVYFLNTSITGNFIKDQSTIQIPSILSLVGIALFICSIILASHSIKEE
jgi:hypothetical protein